MVPKSNMSAIKNKGSCIKGNFDSLLVTGAKAGKYCQLVLCPALFFLDFAKLKYFIQLHCASNTSLESYDFYHAWVILREMAY